MREDDDSMRGIDLSAWEVPPPRRDLADVVVARVREAAAVSPVTTTILAAPSKRRWWLVGGGLAVACAAAIVIIVTTGSRRDDAHGTVVAERAQHVDLGDASGDLDPGADVRWQRDRDTIHVEQPHGVVTWKVGDGHELVIDPGAMGASVEATGASLRVEVHMNHADGRVIAASATTAAIAAIVTVIVYEGHVNVRSGGHEITVAPGATVLVAPNEPPREPLAVGASAPEVVADPTSVPATIPAPCDADALRDQGISETNAGRNVIALELFEQSIACKPTNDATRLAALAACKSEDAPKARRYFGKLSAAQQADVRVVCTRSGIVLAAAPACDAAALNDTARAMIDAGQYSSALAALEKSLACKSDPAIIKLAYMTSCNSRNAVKAKLYFGKLPDAERGALEQICIRNGIRVSVSSPPPPPPSCDADKLREKGVTSVNLGDFGRALESFEAAFKCKPSGELTKLAFLAACNSKNAGKARLYYTKMSPQMQRDVGVICSRNGIDLTKDPPQEATKDPKACDAVGLRQNGSTAVNMGQFAMALGLFEQSLACQQDSTTVKLAYLAACNSKNNYKAKLYFQRMSSQERQDLQLICIRNGIQVP